MRPRAQVYGKVGDLPTHLFLKPLEEGEEVTIEIEKGRNVIVKLCSVLPADADGVRQVIMELDGERWFVPITDHSVESTSTSRVKAKAPGEVCATLAPSRGIARLLTHG